MNGYAKDIFALVADSSMEQAFEGLLAQHGRLNIRRIRYDIEVHPRRDPGCRIDAVSLLRPRLESHGYALVVFDHDGCGSKASRKKLQQEVQEKIERNGWENRCKVIVIEPELENWVWARDGKVSEVLGWGSNFDTLRQWLQEHRLWLNNDPKPCDPKRAMEEAIKQKKVKRSASLFKRIANVSQPQYCRDPAFIEFRETLQRWFPADSRIRN